ncbi:hypothetical protein H5410_056556 [Solanum commersonii]|uniref:Uncharacterized protein n=1 Tax=Solanum commersonii TaxID=4109 RepID=A0A9J5WNF2_SOLCO|nr:hypothetical protein H5410_056556 [Solanum commersonii]
MTSEIWITKRFMEYSTQKSTKWGIYLFWGSFDFVNRSICTSRQTGSIARVLTDVHEKFSKNDHTKIGKTRGLAAPGLFYLDNRQVFPSGPTSSIAKVLTDVHNFFKNDIGNLHHQKIHGLAHKNRQNRGFTRFEDR